MFCHGLMGFDTVSLGPAIAPLQVQHWRGIRDALSANGVEVRFWTSTASPMFHLFLRPWTNPGVCCPGLSGVNNACTSDQLSH